MRNLLLIVGMVFVTQVAAEGGIYRSVDEHGNVTFSDQPSPGAVEIEKKEVPTVPATLPQPPRTDPGVTGDDGQDKEAIAYKRLEITSPENDAVVRDDQGYVSVRVAVDPELAADAGHELVLYMNGSEAVRGGTTGFQLTDVNRGTHSLAVAVVDGQGQELKRSPQVSFHMLQHSALHPRPQAPGTQPGPGGLNPGSIRPGGSN